jgi:hypothetical protein
LICDHGSAPIFLTLGERLILRLSREKYRMNIEHSVAPKERVQKMMGTLQKDIGASLKKLPLARCRAI